MKKALALASSIGYFINYSIVRAQSGNEIKISQPIGNQAGVTGDPSAVISNAFKIVFVFAAIAVLVMLIWGAFQWITSGGDKEAVAKARGRIVNAVIGLVILALSFIIIRVVGNIVNINILEFVIPTLNAPK